MRIVTDSNGFVYQDDGRGLRDEADFEALVKLGESGWDERVEEEQQPMGLGLHALLAHEAIESVSFTSNLLSLAIESDRWWKDEVYAVGWRERLTAIRFPAPGLSIGVTCSKEMTERLIKALSDSRLHIQHLWWKPGSQITLPDGCSSIFYEAGQWGFGGEGEPPAEWRDVGGHVVFTFNDTSNWDVDSVDFTVGGREPQEFYRVQAWAGFDPNNDDGRSYDEMSESYSESCDREIRRVIGNAIPRNFSWDDLIRFVPEGEKIISFIPQYKGRRSHRPETVTLTLSNEEKVRLRIL